MNATTDKIVFVVGTKQESRVIADLGLNSISLDETEPVGEVLRASAYLRELPEDPIERFIKISYRPQYIVMLNEDTAQDFKELCDRHSVPYEVVKSEEYSQAMQSNDVPRFVKEKHRFFSLRMQERRDVAEKAFLEKFEVADTMSIAVDVSSGNAGLELTPTGIDAIDKALDGGLPQGGLTTLGALSSMGKTTLCNQIGDNIASNGCPVLFVTLEQSSRELVSMSANRIDGRNGYDFRNKKPLPLHTRSGVEFFITRQLIQRGEGAWGPGVAERVRRAFGEYQRTVSENMFIMEPEAQPKVGQVLMAARAIGRAKGRNPVVIIDYLQLLRPDNDRRDERTAINDIMGSLRRMARDLKTSVVVISALSRKSFSEGVTMDSFRESSGIEYSADILLGLQPRGMSADLQKVSEGKKNGKAREIVDNARDKDAKDLELRILKNRAGRVPKEGIPLVFDARCSFFYSDENISDSHSSSRLLYSETDDFV